ncbi:MAG: hypothetical protein OXN89_01340 [Bryobacterales bacterium]|nr:hypothetical protein [Bryobacterales bacterium]
MDPLPQLLPFGQHVLQQGPHPVSQAIVGNFEVLREPCGEAVHAFRDRGAALQQEAAGLVTSRAELRASRELWRCRDSIASCGSLLTATKRMVGCRQA